MVPLRSYEKKSKKYVALLFCASMFTFFSIVTLAHLGSTTALASSIKNSPPHPLPLIKNRPSRPFSGIVEGTVVATSSTSITIDKKIFPGNHGTVATSTEETFTFASSVKIHADQGEYATSSISDISIGSSVSLVLQHAGKDAGKVFEIRLQSI
jgi:hypothetical protein